MYDGSDGCVQKLASARVKSRWTPCAFLALAPPLVELSLASVTRTPLSMRYRLDTFARRFLRFPHRLPPNHHREAAAYDRNRRRHAPMEMFGGIVPPWRESSELSDPIPTGWLIRVNTSYSALTVTGKRCSYMNRPSIIQVYWPSRIFVPVLKR